MSPRHFSKVYQSPYFQSSYYKEETSGGKLEKRIERFLKKILRGKND